MRCRPNPYRVLAHALDAGDLRLAELLALRLTGMGLVGAGSAPAAEAAVERLMMLLRVSRARG